MVPRATFKLPIIPPITKADFPPPRAVGRGNGEGNKQTERKRCFGEDGEKQGT